MEYLEVNLFSRKFVKILGLSDVKYSIASIISEQQFSAFEKRFFPF